MVVLQYLAISYRQETGVSVAVYHCAGDHRPPDNTGNHRPLLTSASLFLTFYDLHVRICNINAFRVIGKLNALEHGALERECSGVILRPQRCTQNNRGIRQLKHNDRHIGHAVLFLLLGANIEESRLLSHLAGEQLFGFFEVAFVGTPLSGTRRPCCPHSRRSR